MQTEHAHSTFERLLAETELLLHKHGIATETWGTGATKSIRHLVAEIQAGETALVESDGTLVRQVSLVKVEVLSFIHGELHRLVENRQEFSDGRERRRGLTGVSEKMLPNEAPICAAKRAILEELGITASDFGEITKSVSRSSAHRYPGLETEYCTYHTALLLADSQVDPTGYVEKQDDKTTFFVWEKISQANAPQN